MKEILVVDDVSINLMNIKNAMMDKYKLTLVKSGTQALQRLEFSEPDLIILDVLMPGMDGFQVFDKIRKQYPDKKYPVLFLTAVNDKEKILKILSLDGVIGYVLKPYRMEDLLVKINQFFIDKKRGGK